MARQVERFEFDGELGMVERTLLRQADGSLQETIFVGWGNMGADLSSLEPTAGLADEIDACLAALGSNTRVRRMSPEKEARLAALSWD